MYIVFNITTTSPDPLVGDNMEDIDMTELECNSPVIISLTMDETRPEGAQEQLHQLKYQQHNLET